MTEEKFYQAAELLEDASLPSGLGNYYPTVEEIKISLQGRNLEDFIPILLFYASNPFDGEIAERQTYKDTVKYAKEMTSKINLE